MESLLAGAPGGKGNPEANHWQSLGSRAGVPYADKTPGGEVSRAVASSAQRSGRVGLGRGTSLQVRGWGGPDAPAFRARGGGLECPYSMCMCISAAGVITESELCFVEIVCLWHAVTSLLLSSSPTVAVALGGGRIQSAFFLDLVSSHLSSARRQTKLVLPVVIHARLSSSLGDTHREHLA